MVFATVAHVLVALVVRGLPPRDIRVAVGEPQHEITLDVVAERVLVPSEDPVEARSSSDAPSAAIPGARAAPADRARELSARSAVTSQAEPTEAPVSGSSWSFDPIRRTPSDVGVGSHWKSVVAEGPSSPVPGETAQERARAIDRSMREMLTARDVSIGLGRAGPLVSAAHEAASSSSAPEVGTTILEVDIDSQGRVVTARAEDRAWNGVASALVQRMARKPVRVTHGSRGLRARLRVVAEKAPPSGARGSSGVGAVPDDVPGGTKACEGTGIHRRCVAGMPVGVTNAQHDTSNVGANPTRIVHVQLLAETEL
jgi:hypothetical protein